MYVNALVGLDGRKVVVGIQSWDIAVIWPTDWLCCQKCYLLKHYMLLEISSFFLILQLIISWFSFRFVYKFVCDLKNLLGYSAGELSRLVLEAEETANDLEPGTNGGH